jgi:L-alanine-DL-glutamate epimerase-like enolase superfamily enzyme
MKVTELILTLIRWDLPASYYAGYRAAFKGEKLMGVVTIRTDAGVEGHSFLGHARQGADVHASPLMDLIKPVVVGRNPLDIGAIWAKMWPYNRYVSVPAIGAVDVALWDLAGKVAGLPVHRLLGSCRQRVPAYASSMWLPSAQTYADEAIHYRSRRWPAYKMHVHGIPGEDIAICRAVREAVGDDMVLMIDSMHAYTYEEALKVGRALEELKYFWYEDPLPEEDLYGYVKLRNKLDIPILATEWVPGGLYGLEPWVLYQATDMLRGDVGLKGGITPLVKIAHLAEAFRMKCEIHTGLNSLNNVANLHVTMAIENCDYYEVLLPEKDNQYGLVADIEVDNEGFVHAPEKPGLGYDIDWDLVKHKTVRVLQ